MNFLLFDENAIAAYVGINALQSVEYSQGKRLINHIRGKLQSEIFENTIVEYCDEGIIFIGKDTIVLQKKEKSAHNNFFCIDLNQCKITDENDNWLLFILQKIFRTVLKIWHRQPFSISERVHGSKSIVFPFAYPDPRRVVIERSKNVLQLDKGSRDFPLLAYKYNAEDPPQDGELVNISVLKTAKKLYYLKYNDLKGKLKGNTSLSKDIGLNNNVAIHSVEATESVRRGDFIYWTYEQQYQGLTNSQKEVIDYDKVDSPLRIDGAAGTGKTISMIMRAYKLLEEHKRGARPFNIIFFSHSQSTFQRNFDVFRNYSHSSEYLDKESLQHITFIPLSDFCMQYAGIPMGALIERDAGDAKTYQLMLIENVVTKAVDTHKVRTYRSLLSQEMQDVFNSKKTPSNVLYAMLQHEFSVQIKGRTDGTIDGYYKIEPIPNGLPCKTKKDKEFVFLLFCDYQSELKSIGSFDVDDVVMEALSRLNAPIWRRERAVKGYDYIFVDEMHLFNVNEQSIFHFLTKSLGQKDIPMCFAIDYSQAIGDRGNLCNDYIQGAFGKIKSKEYSTVFRNSPQIADFCAAIAASGIIMFRDGFSNPYRDTRSNFTQEEEYKSRIPSLYMYENDNDMVRSLKQHINTIIKELQCKKQDIVVIAFDDKFYSDMGVEKISSEVGRAFVSINNMRDNTPDKVVDKHIVASPYDINGLEFQAVILLGVDEGRVPQTMGTSDISQHFIRYSAYNMIYLAASRAKYRLIVLGSKLRGRSSCLEHSIKAGYLEIKKE